MNGESTNSAPSKTFEHYESECQEYFNKVYHGLRKILFEGWDQYAKELNALYHLYIFQNYLLDSQEKYFINKAQICISTFYSKAASDILCLYECLRQGQLISAISIERNIFESYVNLKLIMDNDTENRIKLYENFAIVQRWNRLQEFEKYLAKLRESPDTKPEKLQSEEKYFNQVFLPDEIKRIKTEYEIIKSDYLEKYPFHWAWKIYKDKIKKGKNPSVAFICQKLGITYQYMQFYSLNSIVVHSEPLMTSMLEQRGGITPSPIFSDRIRNIAATSFYLVTEIILMTLKYAESPKLDEVELYLFEKWDRVF